MEQRGSQKQGACLQLNLYRVAPTFSYSNKKNLFDQVSQSALSKMWKPTYSVAAQLLHVHANNICTDDIQ